MFVKSAWYGSTGTVGEIFWEKFVQYSNLFGLWPKFFGTFRGKISEALLKRNCTTPVQHFREKLFWKKKCFNFFELARIIGLWAEGIKQDAWTKFYLIRERICRKKFSKKCYIFWTVSFCEQKFLVLSVELFWQLCQN